MKIILLKQFWCEKEKNRENREEIVKIVKKIVKIVRRENKLTLMKNRTILNRLSASVP